MLNLKYKKVIEEKPYLRILEKVPHDLKAHIEALNKVLRFQLSEYPKDVLKDSTKAHTLKCIYLANEIDFNLSKERLIRTLWVHDIPELIINDITVIEKHRNPRIANKLDNEEDRAAKKLLNKEDQELLSNFNKAYEVLKGNKSLKQDRISKEAFIAKLIDNSEGNMTFHYFISRWVASEKYREELLPPIDSFQYSFITNQRFYKNIKQNFSQEHKEDLLKLINITLENIEKFWGEVPIDRIPSGIGAYLNKLSKKEFLN